MHAILPLAVGAAALMSAHPGGLLPVEAECPEGAEIAGSAPPSGGERYCRKLLPDGRVVRHGWYTAWYRNGGKAVEGEYRDGERTGQWLRFWEDGRRFEDLSYRGGKLEGPYLSWHRSGKPSAAGQYREHWQAGRWAFWHDTGAKAAEGDYAAGFQEGRWTYWRPDGTLLGSGEYRSGLMRKEGVALPVVPGLALHDEAGQEARGPRAGATGSRQPGSPRLEVAVDSRIELISAALSLTIWPELGPWNEGGTDYARAMREAFGSLRDHAAIRMLDAMVRDGFTFDVPLRWILHYGPPPALEPRMSLDAYVRRRAGGERVLGELAAAMRTFARDSRFMAFYHRHKGYYDSLAGAYRQTAPRAAVPALLEAYYGTRRSGYHALVAPMLGTRPYAFRLGGASGPEHETLFSVAAPHFQEGGRFRFDPAQVRTSLYREFNRGFTEPAIERAFGTGVRPDLYALAKPDMDDLGLPTWRWALSELGVRAAEIRLLRHHGFEAEASDLLREGTSVDRFVWLPYAVDRLAEYEADRGRFPSFADFGSRFLGILDDTDPVTVSGRLMFLLRRQ